MIKALVLRYYNAKEPLTLQVDEPQSGLEATLFQNRQPVAMVSKALDRTQTIYVVIAKVIQV